MASRISPPIVALAVVLAIPIVPFLLYGPEIEDWVEGRFTNALTPSAKASLVVAVLATDILLPIPSSFVSTFAGAHLGVVLGALASWLGMTIGAVLGFLLARTGGRPLAVRLSSADELERMQSLGDRYGPYILAMTRPLPVLAEAAVLWMGLAKMSWRRFLPVILLSNAGIALAYSAFGYWAQEYNALPAALAASILLPLLGAAVARRRMTGSTASD